jgi:tetracycline repressor-like protein
MGFRGLAPGEAECSPGQNSPSEDAELTDEVEFPGSAAFAAIAERLRAARDAGRLRVDDPDTLARLFLGALTRGSMLIAASGQPRATRDEVARAVRTMLQGLSAWPARSRRAAWPSGSRTPRR